MPVFITSAKKEHAQWRGIFAAIGTKTKASYLPKTAGNHGSRALWKKFGDNAGYWTAVEAFLPHLEGDNGMTVAELAIPRLRMLTEQGGAVRLLEDR